MARSKDSGPLQSQGWLHELARGEVFPEADKLLQTGSSLDPHQMVEESTIQFLSELRERFTEYAKIFNTYSDNGSKFPEVKVYAIAQTPADFMLFRNQVKLIFSNPTHGVIQIAFTQHVRGAMAVDGFGQQAAQQPSYLGGGQELMAQVGPFRDIYWAFQSERVVPEQVAKFYFAEFIKATRDNKKSKSGNQVLLDQIKALLQQKGLDL